jgi:hypothetical protein
MAVSHENVVEVIDFHLSCLKPRASWACRMKIEPWVSIFIHSCLKPRFMAMSHENVLQVSDFHPFMSEAMASWGRCKKMAPILGPFSSSWVTL